MNHIEWLKNIRNRVEKIVGCNVGIYDIRDDGNVLTVFYIENHDTKGFLSLEELEKEDADKEPYGRLYDKEFEYGKDPKEIIRDAMKELWDLRNENKKLKPEMI